MKKESPPIVKAQMMLRVPVNEVYEAMTNPDHVIQFPS